MSKVAKWFFPAAGGKDGIIGTIKAVVGIATGNPSLIAAGIAQVAGMGKAEAAVRQASVTTLQIGEVPREALLGEACIAGSLIDAFNHGGTYGTDTVTRCIGLVDHAVDAIVGFYVDDRYYAWTADGLQAAFSNKLSLTFRNATAAGYAPPATALANGWAATDRLCGVTHIWVSTDVDDKVWSRGHPEFRFVLRGLRVFDPRFDPALGYVGASPQTWENRASHVFSRNAALLRYAYARGIYAEGRQGEAAHLLVGRGLTAEEAPPARIIAAVNLCDEVVAGQPRYAASGVIRSTDAFIAVEEMFAGAMAGVIVQREGGVEVEPGQAKAAVATITDADLVIGEPVRFSRFLPDGSDGRVNTVVPSYVEPAQGWKDHAGPVRRSLTDITADKGPRFLALPLPLVTAGAQADRNAEIARLISRLERRADIVLPPDHAQLEEGDWIAWTSARYHGGATVRYRIESWTLDEKWRMRLSLREIASTVYGVATPLTDASDPPPAPPTVGALALTGVTATVVLLAGTGSSVPAVRFAWTAVDPAVIAIRAEVRRVGETVASATRSDDVAALAMTVTNGVGPDQALEVRLVPITSLTRPVTPSAWIALTTGALTAGDVTPIVPGNVAGTPTLSITTTIAPDGTQSSRLFGMWTAPANALTYVVEIDDGTLIQQVPAPENAIEDRIVATGPTYRYRVRAQSRTGTLAAAWSAWSASVPAGGDTTIPGAFTGVTITALARRLVLSWTPPADADYSHLKLYRNTTGVSPGATEAGLYQPRVTGSIFPDTNVAAGTTYHYWARPVDRTGNVGALVSMGSATPAFTSVAGGDVGPTDAVLVTTLGVASAIAAQAPWATSTIPISHLTSPGSNIFFNGSLKLGIQGWLAGTVITNDPGSGLYLILPAGTTMLSARQLCSPGISYVLSCESTSYLSTGHGIYVVFWNAADGYLGESGICGTGTNWAKTASPAIVAPAGTAKFSIHSTVPSLGGGYVLMRKIKLEAGTVTSPWNDDATNGALYRNGAPIDSLQPAELGATLGARAGTNLFRADGVTVLLQSEVRTAEGNAAGVIGGSDWLYAASALRTPAQVASAINTAGAALKVTAATSLIHSTGAASAVGGQPYSMVAGDGEAVTFPVSYGVPPLVMPVAADNLDALVTAGDYYQTGAVSVSASGFTGRARRRNPGSGGTSVVRTDDGAGNATAAGNAGTLFRNKALSGVANDRRYTATFQVRMIGVLEADGSITPQPMTVGFYGRQTIGGAWVLLASETYTSVDAVLTTSTKALNGEVDWTTWSTYGDWEYKLQVIAGYSVNRMCLYDFVSVQWTEITGASGAVDATALSGGRKLTYIVFPPAG